jgi:phosphatidylserine/phosphatidylglycerophosphate/cardiolipin synthase-like enzyme
LCFVYLYAEPDIIQLPKEQAPIHFYSNQTADDLRKTVREAIDSAKTSISLAIFSLSDPQIIGTLRKKADEGVKVSIVADKNATPDVEWLLGPKIECTRYHGKALMHDKLMVIDHETLWLGSTNFTRESLVLYANLLLGIHSKTLAQATEKKIQALVSNNNDPFLPHKLETGIQTVEIRFLPDDKTAIGRLLDVIQKANSSIRVAMFTFTNKKLIQALVDAHRRGVKVDVVIDNDSARKTSLKAFQRLKREGVPTAISNRNGLLHHKLMIVDDAIVATGSANWTEAAFTKNDDNLCFVYPLTLEQKEKMNYLWTTIQAESRPTFSKVK